MKIVALQAENIKRLVAVDIRPTDNLVQITGKNGQGKSSVLDSIWWALAGAGTVQAEPIRQGETQARIRLDLGEIVVTRKFTKNEEGETTSAITVENAEGARFPSPQRMLDGLLGELSFDPLAFSRMATKDKFEVLKKFVAFDFAKLALENAEDFTQRTHFNRSAKECRAAGERVVVPAGTPADTIDEKVLMVELESAQVHNRKIQEVELNARALSDKLANMRSGISAKKARVQQEIEHMEKRIAEMRDQLLKEENAVGALILKAESEMEHLRQINTIPLISVDDIMAKLKEASTVNGWVNLRKQKEEHLFRAAEYEEQAKSRTLLIDERNKQAVKAISEAQLPVTGVTIGVEGEVRLNGVPFEQASDAEQLRASIEFAMAVNPKLRVIRVRDGSLLDEDAMRTLSSMALDKDYQVWVERVTNGEKCGFIIEDGRLKE